MTENIDREELIGLLGALSAEKDEDVLSTAREIHSKVTGAGHDWNDLLVGDDDDDDEHDQPVSMADSEPESEAPSGDVPDDAETLSLIERILQIPGVSEALREELEGYREDISEGEMEAMDRRYLQSLFERMKNA